MVVQTKFVVAFMIFDQVANQGHQIARCAHILAGTNHPGESYLKLRNRLLYETWCEETVSFILARQPRLLFVNEEPEVLRLIYGVLLPGSRKLVAYKPAVSLANLPGMKKIFFNWAEVNAQTELVI